MDDKQQTKKMMDSLRLLPPLITSKDKLEIDEEEEEEEDKEIKMEILQHYEDTKSDVITQTDPELFSDQCESHQSSQYPNLSNTEVTNDSKKSLVMLDNDFYPQFKENEIKIDSQLERIEQEINRLQLLTANFNQDISPEQYASCGQSESPISEEPQKTTKKKKTKKKLPKSGTFHKKKRSKNAEICPHKKFEPAPFYKPKGNHPVIHTGDSIHDAIILRSGYPIVFEYETDDLIRHEKVPHGPLKSIFKNGDIKYQFRDGTIKIKTSKGFQYTYYNNGDKQVIFPDGVNAYKYRSNNCVEFRSSDNTLIYYFANGQLEEHFSDGSTRVQFPDQTSVKISPDKTRVYKDKKGKKRKGKVSDDFNTIEKSPNSNSSTPIPREKVPAPQNDEDSLITTPKPK